jgi:hypothetical protein
VAVKPTVTLKPFMLIVVPGYEAYIVARDLRGICEYMERLEVEYKWELIFVNDGSTGVDFQQGVDKEVRFQLAVLMVVCLGMREGMSTVLSLRVFR